MVSLSGVEDVDGLVVTYLNRLSDLLFTFHDEFDSNIREFLHGEFLGLGWDLFLRMGYTNM